MAKRIGTGATPGQALEIYEVDDLQEPYLLRYEEFTAGSWADAHSHRLGHLNYTTHGTFSMDTRGHHLVSPPQYGIWIPPGVEHSCYVQHAVVYRSFYVQPALCTVLPDEACIVKIGPIVRSILANFAQRAVRLPRTPEDLRLAEVMVDQLRVGKVERSYLPVAESAALTAVLNQLHTDPGSRLSMAQWAHSVHMTERTLARHCQRELGMSLGEWRQRLRYVCAVDALERGKTVQEIAFDLGFSTASAFIAMFQRETGMAPDQFRREFSVPAV